MFPLFRIQYFVIVPKRSHARVFRAHSSLVSTTSEEMASTVIEKYHPKDAKLCSKTLKTISCSFQTKSMVHASLASVSFRSKNELNTFFKWLKHSLDNADNISSFPVARKLLSERKKKEIFLESCRVFVAAQNISRAANNFISDIDTSLLNIVDVLPERLVLDISAVLRRSSAELSLYPQSSDTLNSEVLKKIIETSSIHFDKILDLIVALGFVRSGEREHSLLRTKALRIQKERVKLETNLSVHFLRLMENAKEWESSDTGNEKISRVDKLSLHQWGWSLHCLPVVVNSNAKSPLDAWLLEEESRILLGKSSSSVFTAEEAGNLEDEGLLLAPTKPALKTKVTSAFIPERVPGLSPDFDEPFEFQDIVTWTPEARNQSSLDAIAKDLDMHEKLKFSSSRNKFLISNLPPEIREEDVRCAFVRTGANVEFVQIFHPERFEAGQPCNATLDGKNVNKKSQKKHLIHSDTYAYVAFDSSAAYDTLIRGDVHLFGLCLQGYRCQLRPAGEFRSFYVETLVRMNSKLWIDTIGSILGHDFEILYGSAYNTSQPAYLQLKFDNHEDAWKSYLLLELALEDGVQNFQLSWRKSTWYRELQMRSRSKRRNNRKYLNSIAEKIRHQDSQGIEEDFSELKVNTV